MSRSNGVALKTERRSNAVANGVALVFDALLMQKGLKVRYMTIHVDMQVQAEVLAAGAGLNPWEVLGIITGLRFLALRVDPRDGGLGVKSDEALARLLRIDEAVVKALREGGAITSDYRVADWDFGETGLKKAEDARKAGKASAQARAKKAAKPARSANGNGLDDDDIPHLDESEIQF